MNKKLIILTLALALVLGVAVGGTLAWLTAKTDPVVNTFTVGNIILELKETVSVYKMVPGTDMKKDPTVVVREGSEACYVYVKVEKTIGTVTVGATTYTFDDFLTVAMAEGWEPLPDHSDIYYFASVIQQNDEIQRLPVLKDNKVTTKSTVTKEMLSAITTENGAKLTFTAYAVQREAGDNAVTAWNQTFGAQSGQ